MTRRAIPDLDRLIAVCRGQVLAIGGPGDPIHPTGAAVDPGGVARNGIPDLDRLVETGGSDALAIGRPGHSSHTIKMAAVD